MGPLIGFIITAGPSDAYSAVQETSDTQTLADGTRISPKPAITKIFHDSQGRTHTERPICYESADDPNGWGVIIKDPVSGYGYILDTENHTAYRYSLQVRRPGQPLQPVPTKALLDSANKVVPPPDRPANLRPQSTEESLGSQTMEGVFVNGTKTTSVLPVGSMDNDRPITIVTERWISPDLKIVVLEKTSDPRHGETTTRLTNIDRSEPESSLFQPPADYKIVDGRDPVRLTCCETKPSG